jgi:DEAD/DEAH box helicase domain-containing protein
MSDMLDAFVRSVGSLEWTVAEKVDLPARSEQFAPIPAEYARGRVGRWLGGGQFSRGLWTHQTEALRAFEAGANVVISTGTGSGKSLVFQAAALRILDQRPDSTVLVLYPLKALVADQLVSWRKIIRAHSGRVYS